MRWVQVIKSKKISHLFLDDLEHIPDLKCVLKLECVLDNMNELLILNVLFKNFLSLRFHSFTNRSNIYKNAFYAKFFFQHDGIVLDHSIHSCERTIIH